MKKAAILAAALAMVLTLAACGNRDNKNGNDNTGVTTNGGQNSGSGTNSGVSGSHDRDDPVTGSNGSTTGNGSSAGNDPITGSSGSLNDDNDVTDRDGRDNGDDSSMGRSRVGNDLRRAADDVGDAMTGLADAGRSAVTRGTSTTTFQRMLDNARVHDVDGVLTDGENSRW